MRLRHVVLMACVLFCWIWALPLLCVGLIFSTPLFLFLIFWSTSISCYLQWRNASWICGDHWLRDIVSSIPWFEWFPCNTLSISDTPQVVCVHPHGFLSCGALVGIHFVPGNRTIFCVAPALFYIPVFGWCIRLLGCIPAKRDIMLRALRQGYSVLVVPGGVPEVILSEQCRDTLLFLKQRYGFVKVAMACRVPLLPVFVRGETALFRPVQWPLFKLRVHLSYVLNIPLTLPFFAGWYGTWIPKRKPLTLLEGKRVVTKGVPMFACKRKYVRHLRELENTIETIKL